MDVFYFATSRKDIIFWAKHFGYSEEDITYRDVPSENPHIKVTICSIIYGDRGVVLECQERNGKFRVRTVKCIY